MAEPGRYGRSPGTGRRQACAPRHDATRRGSPPGGPVRGQRRRSWLSCLFRLAGRAGVTNQLGLPSLSGGKHRAPFGGNGDVPNSPRGGEAPAAFRPSRPPGHSAPRQGARRRNHRHARKSSPTLTETRPPAPPSRAVSAGRSHPAPGRPINPSPRACRRAARQSRLDTPRSASSVRPRMLASCLAKACITASGTRAHTQPGLLRFVTSWTSVANRCGHRAGHGLDAGSSGILKTWNPPGARAPVCAPPWTCIT